MSCPVLVPGDPASWDPHARFRELRDAAPVQPVLLPGDLTAWLVTGAAAAREALVSPLLAHDPRRVPNAFTHRRYPDDIFAAEGRHLLNSDGPDHRRLRTALAPLFTRAAAERARPLIERLCAGLLAGTVDDLVADYARPLATRTTAAFLGIPQRWVPELSRLTLTLINAPDPAGVATERTELFRLWARILGAKRRSSCDDALSLLVRTPALAPQELVSVAWGLFSGGVSPATTFVASAAVELLRHPAVPRSTPPIDELLRLVSPFPVATWRFALADTTIGGTPVPRGAVVLVGLAAANRDPAELEAPDTLLADRPRAAAHLAFGLRPHHCPGAHLARLQATIALTALFTRFPRLRLAVPATALRHHGLLVERCYDSVPVHTGA